MAQTEREQLDCLSVCETARHNGRDRERTTRLFVCDCVIQLDTMAEIEREQLDCFCVRLLDNGTDRERTTRLFVSV